MIKRIDRREESIAYIPKAHDSTIENWPRGKESSGLHFTIGNPISGPIHWISFCCFITKKKIVFVKFYIILRKSMFRHSIG